MLVVHINNACGKFQVNITSGSRDIVIDSFKTQT